MLIGNHDKKNLWLLRIYLMSKLRKVEPKPFGRIGLVAMSRKEHDSIGDWALQQKRRRQLNELFLGFSKRAPLGMPSPVTKGGGRSGKI